MSEIRGASPLSRFIGYVLLLLNTLGASYNKGIFFLDIYSVIRLLE